MKQRICTFVEGTNNLVEERKKKCPFFNLCRVWIVERETKKVLLE